MHKLQKFPLADPPSRNPMTTPPLPEQIELHRDRMWRRDEDLRIESAFDAERFIEDVGFANKRSEIRSQRSGFGVSVLAAFLPPRQKDEETRLTWYLKDEVMRRGRVCVRLPGETRGRSFDVCRAGSDKPFCRHLKLLICESTQVNNLGYRRPLPRGDVLSNPLPEP
jgi:hypothetical protein